MCKNLQYFMEKMNSITMPQLSDQFSLSLLSTLDWLKAHINKFYACLIHSS